MEKRFGIFMALGSSVNYQTFSGTPLIKMNIKDFGSLEEAESEIEQYSLAPAGAAIFILPFYQYTKR